jgi:hypothetical protein
VIFTARAMVGVVFMKKKIATMRADLKRTENRLIPNQGLGAMPWSIRRPNWRCHAAVEFLFFSNHVGLEFLGR